MNELIKVVIGFVAFAAYGIVLFSILKAVDTRTAYDRHSFFC